MRQSFLCALLLAPVTAAAQPTSETATTKRADEPSVPISDERPLRKSYLLPAVETTGLTLMLSAGAQLYGADWADVSTSTMWHNITGGWVWDEDPFTIDQLGHPYGGATVFGAARSSGLGFWTASAYSFAGSFMWELLLENEPPSLNDQITTPIGGALLGESFHRIGRALRDGHPGVVRRTAAALIDPMGELNRHAWGRAWRDEKPWSYYAHLGVGYSQLSSGFEGARDTNDQNQLHTELVLQHGLVGDREFEPSHPYDHFELRGSVDVAREHVVAKVDLSGILAGNRFGGDEGFGGLYGLYGTYDYSNLDHTRVSAIGVGPGVTTELPIGTRDFLRLTGIATVLPWGAAGGENEEEMGARDYHRGPGLGQLGEIEVGRRELASLRLTSRAFEIAGGLVGDGGTEIITNHTLGGMFRLAPNHSIGVEGTFALRRATFTDDRMSPVDKTVEARVFYALTSGR